jgi:anti-sigma factor RsiW
MITDDALIGYLDGQADLARAREIEAALAGSPELRRRLAELEARDQDVREAFDALLEAPVPDALAERVRAAAAGQGRVVRLKAPARPRLAGTAPASAAARPAWLGWALAAQFAGLVVLTGLVIHPVTPRPTPAYHALGAAPAAVQPNLMVIFDPQTPEASLRETLRAAGVRVVGGPTEADAWLLLAAPDARAAALAKLRGAAGVVLAQPLDPARAR